MNIFEFAMQMEKDGEQYYRELAHKTTDSGLANILHNLADAEVKHYNVLKQMQDQQEPAMGEDTVRENTRNVFQQIQEKGESIGLEGDEIDAYKKARDIEERSRKFYMEKAKELGSPASEELFYKIADEEKVHCQILESIIDFVSRPLPGNWLENAEWVQSEDY
ncbi:MAG: ferritin family protein [Lentisphaerae bacterium]|nr:ferritin family protein [Lentisphaerota bacterium]